MSNNKIGNIITGNALDADDGRDVIDRAVVLIDKECGWRVADPQVLFSGVYYDSQKVGSWIAKVEHSDGRKGVLKLQLKPLDYDEGFIVRQIEKYNRSKRIRLPQIFIDQPWDKELGFGFLIFEDLSELPNLWKNNVTDADDRKLHAEFLEEFFDNLLPVESWLEKPGVSLKEMKIKGFEHFYAIAQASSHKHVDGKKIEAMRKIYFEMIDQIDLGELHFTHAHMSGKDIKYDKKNGSFILLANLYWSFRPLYYELTFPIWVDIMHVGDKDFGLDKILYRIEEWSKVFQRVVKDSNLSEDKRYWFNLLQRAMATVMLDLGACEWKHGKEAELEALLKSWEELFYWIIEEKLI